MHAAFDGAILAAIGVTHWSIGRRLLAAIRRRLAGRRLRWAYAAVALYAAAALAGFLLSISEVVSFLHLPPRPSAVLGAAACFWLFGCTAAWACYYAFHLLAPRPLDPDRRRVLKLAGGAFAASPFLVAGYGALVQRTDFRVREVDVPLPGLAPDLDGLRLLQLSDIHLSAFLSERELARVVDMANELRPRLAVITGDLISSRGDPLDACLRQLARLRAEAGILGCLGNHETYAGAEEHATEAGARLGIRFLRSQAEPIRFGQAVINFAGVDYQRMSWREHYLEGAERLVTPDALNVLLSHNPDVFPVAAAKGFDLTLSGHTHGGQVTVEILDQPINPARFFTRYVYGLYEHGPARQYVTRGIGTIGIPARIGAPPEITLLRLRKA